jgi:hypothetical protein
LGYILPHVFILSEDRFHLCTVPYIAIPAASLGQWICAAFCALQRSGTGKWIVSLAIFAAFLLVANWGFELIRDADKIARLLGPNGNQSYFPY